MHLIPAVIVGLILQAKRDKADAVANEILKDMEPVYVPKETLKFNQADAARLQDLLDKVDMVARDAENATSQIKVMKEGS